MNCHDIARILDERDLALLDEAVHDAVGAHLKSCKDCASAWTAHERLRAASIPALPPGLAARCRALAASSASARPRRGGGPVVIGSFLFVAVAAAAAVGWHATLQERGAGSEAATFATDPVSASGIGAGDPGAGSVTLAPAAAGAPAAADDFAAAADADDEFSVAVTFAHRGTSPDARRLAESVYVIVLDELRALPHLKIVEIEADDEDEDEPAPATSALPEPRAVLTVPSAQTGQAGPDQIDSTVDLVLVAPPGMTAGDTPVPTALRERIASIEAGTTIGGASAIYATGVDEPAESGIVNVLLNNNISGVRVDLSTITSDGPAEAIESEFDYRLDIRSGGSGDTWSLEVKVTALSARAQGGLASSVGSSNAADADPRELADPLIRSLRESVFPDESLLAGYGAMVLDTSLPIDERLRTLNRMRSIEERYELTGRSESVLRAAASMAPGADARQRAEIWRSVRGAHDPVLVAPLRDAVLYELYETSEAVRLEAVISLAEYADDDAGARAALESVANQADASPSLKLHAQWATLDDDGRRALVIAKLTDAGLPVAERLGLLAFRPDWSVGNVDTIDVGASVDPRVADMLAEMVTTTTDAAERRSALNALSVIRSPNLVPLYLDRLGNDPEESLRNSAALGLTVYVNEPGVRPALERALARESSPAVRRTVERILSLPQ